MKPFQPIKKAHNNDKIVVSVRISTEKLTRIDELAGNFDISRNEFINQCIDYALDHIVFKKDSDTA